MSSLHWCWLPLSKRWGAPWPGNPHTQGRFRLFNKPNCYLECGRKMQYPQNARTTQERFNAERILEQESHDCEEDVCLKDVFVRLPYTSFFENLLSICYTN